MLFYYKIYLLPVSRSYIDYVFTENIRTFAARNSMLNAVSLNNDIENKNI